MIYFFDKHCGVKISHLKEIGIQKNFRGMKISGWKKENYSYHILNRQCRKANKKKQATQPKMKTVTRYDGLSFNLFVAMEIFFFF